jgi:hypothetical protein
MADQDPDLDESSRQREPETDKLGRFLLRGCLITVGITVLAVAFVFGACFIGAR